jgi:uncharacterized membrane protein YgcG
MTHTTPHNVVIFTVDAANEKDAKLSGTALFRNWCKQTGKSIDSGVLANITREGPGRYSLTYELPDPEMSKAQFLDIMRNPIAAT